MKLDVSCMRYLTRDDFRVLVAVEMGMRNHEMVPVPLISSIAKLRHGGMHRILSNLLKFKLLAHTNNEYNGYRLSYLGYDILALHTLSARNIVASVGNQIGVGKESDIFEAVDPEGNELVIKIHRLGRTSFRAVRKSRDYLRGKSKVSWLYLSRLAATKEFAFMSALHDHNFPTPIPIDQNRHIVAMSRIPGSPMSQLKAGALTAAQQVFENCLGILKKLAEHGLVHCDLNEFNLMVDHESSCSVTMIDFPQMISTSHPNAQELFNRDQGSLFKFFSMKMKYNPPEDDWIDFNSIVAGDIHIDEQVRASGFNNEEDQDISEYLLQSLQDGATEIIDEAVNEESVLETVFDLKSLKAVVEEPSTKDTNNVNSDNGSVNDDESGSDDEKDESEIANSSDKVEYAKNKIKRYAQMILQYTKFSLSLNVID